ncbi:MAG TPA: MerR family transcriptional regulator [Thermotogota bacterium]|mgnify:CR=1 FL=1|nr:MerR family transcriptional regulator [Thermotogota bacterium]HPJ88032.1 MerR family transcriptional regulator [Thermotogota bacterium]HPR97468.1 MerR family transcriptional regulator [Thermotogota bacterium]
MKIGEFAKKFDARIDTIRYYIDNGMILPEKLHSQYRFDDKCVEDMTLIKELKNMKFKITEIKKILSFKRLTNLIDKDNLEYYAQFFAEKLDDLKKEEKDIKASIKAIEEKITEIENTKKTLRTKIGIPLQFFNLLYCPKCQHNLKLYNAIVDGNSIYNGELYCDCGYKALIQDGIIIDSDIGESVKKVLEVNKFSPEEYLEQTDPIYISFTQKPVQWVLKRMTLESLNNKLILDIGTGNGMVMTTVIKEIDRSNFFIATDNNLNQLKKTKALMEKNGIAQNSIFIASEFQNIPLKWETIDIVLDIFGTTNHVFQEKEFLFSHIKPYLKHDGVLYGTYIYLKPRSSDMTPEFREFRRWFMLESIKTSLNDFEIEEATTFGFTESRGDLAVALKEGSRIHQWACKAKKV